MKQFLAIYTGIPGRGANITQEQRAEGGAAWAAWMEEHKDRIVGIGGPLGKTKLVDRSGVSDTSNHMAAYTLVRAESHEDAARLFEGHPHFTIFPGDGVEVMECMPVPSF